MSDERTHWHVGHPVDPTEALELVRRGLTPYLPTDPVDSYQIPYVIFAAKPEGAPKP